MKPGQGYQGGGEWGVIDRGEEEEIMMCEHIKSKLAHFSFKCVI